ncbi:MAG TPA: hypothetical protein VMB22_05915 [Verrucomicrobiae bacterium]|nr:hypothetical protein [Verrucomicrobiae bacterium]
MTKRHLLIICLIAASFIGAVSSQEIRTNEEKDVTQINSTNDWHPDTKVLDSYAGQTDPLSGEAYGTSLVHDVKNFYQLLHDKKWSETYELHAKAFREDNQETDCLAMAKKYESKWDLVNYEILSVQVDASPGSTNVDEAMLICKFTEHLGLPRFAGYHELVDPIPFSQDSYAAVFWHRENGVWKCMSAGPINYKLFEGAARPPTIDWR